MLAAPDLDVLWVVGANPLKAARSRSTNAFVVVQDLFLTETAQRADVVSARRVAPTRRPAP